MTRPKMKMIPFPRARGWSCRKCGDSVNTVTRACRGCGLVVERAISKDPYVAENLGPAYQPPAHALPDDDTPLGALRPSVAPPAEPVKGRTRRLVSPPGR